MLHGNKNCNNAATVLLYACTITSALLVLVAAHEPLRAQTGEPVSFESRFFFNNSPALTPPQQSAPPRAPIIEHSAPSSSKHDADSEGAQHSGSADNLITFPAAAVASPPPFGKTQASDVVTPTKSVPTPLTRVRPIGSGRAAWYEHPGRTASGERFDPDRLTAAHKTLPLGTRLRVVNLQNGRSVVVRVNDRVPLKARHVTIDLSRGSARAIGIKDVGRVALYQLDGPQ
jgi:rare lipoprotein A (peptidoglycan hydrolase)